MIIELVIIPLVFKALEVYNLHLMNKRYVFFVLRSKIIIGLVLSCFVDRDYIYVFMIMTIFQLESVLTNKTAVLILLSKHYLIW